MHEQSHSNVNYNTNSNTVVRTAGTTGSKDLDGRKYSDVTMLFDDLKAQGIVNEQFKAWYCSVFFKLGRDRVLVLASQARADGTDPQKLFSHLLQKESGIKQTTGATK